MSKIWDDREKSLENEYFRRKEQELIEKLRAQRAEKAKAAAASPFNCPRCDGTLIEHTFENVQIDRCNKCSGFWLDSLELELLVLKRQQNEGWVIRMWNHITGD